MSTGIRLTRVFLPVTLATTSLLVPSTHSLLAQELSSPVELPVGVEVIPQNALMTISVTTDSAQWQQLQQFGNSQSQAVLNRLLARVYDDLLTQNSLDYRKDIQPWVGKEVTIAFLSSLPGFTQTKAAKPASAATPPQDTAIVLPIQGANQAKQTFERFKPRAKRQLLRRNYKGIQIKEIRDKSNIYAAALLDTKFLVVTTAPRTINRIIDTYKGGSTLATTPGMTQALGKIQVPQSFGTVYVNLPAASMSATTGLTQLGIPGQQAQTDENQGLAATIALESEGIRLKGISWLTPNSQLQYKVQNSAGMMPNRLPAETLVMTSGGSLKQFWQDYAQTPATNFFPILSPSFFQAVLQSITGMNWERDFLSWMTGEFTFALVSAPQKTRSNLPFGFVFMVQTSDRLMADRSLAQLNQVMAKKHGFKIQQTKIGTQSVTNWTSPKGGPTVSQGWMDGNIAFLTFGTPLANAILPKPTVPLAATPLFKTAVSSDLAPNNGHFFLNVEQAIGGGSNLPLFPLPPASRNVVSVLRSIGVTAAISDARSVRYDVFVALQKSGK